MALAAGAVSLAGCGTLGPRPLSIEEKIWFDNAKGYEYVHDDPYMNYPSHRFDPYASAPYRR